MGAEFGQYRVVGTELFRPLAAWVILMARIAGGVLAMHAY